MEQAKCDNARPFDEYLSRVENIVRLGTLSVHKASCAVGERHEAFLAEDAGAIACSSRAPCCRQACHMSWNIATHALGSSKLQDQ